MSAEAALAHIRASNAERQRRYRERQKALRNESSRADDAQRQRRHRERQALIRVSAPASRILAHVDAHPGVTAVDAARVLSDIDVDTFVSTVATLVRDGRLRCNAADQHRLYAA